MDGREGGRGGRRGGREGGREGGDGRGGEGGRGGREGGRREGGRGPSEARVPSNVLNGNVQSIHYVISRHRTSSGSF